MPGNENTDALRKILELTRKGGIFMLILHFYDVCRSFFSTKGWEHFMMDEFIGKLSKTGLYDSPHTAKLLAFVLLMISLLGIQGKKSVKIRPKALIVLFLLGLIVYWGSMIVLDSGSFLYSGEAAYMFLVGVGVLVLLFSATMLSRYIRDYFEPDIFNKINEAFPQE
ncbi:MAG: conjugal transfer protein TraG, partial [Mongoliibacter sp.]|uniref:YWFCY domain-containing protein n=1 Tax=Mongoliibacter sp. TaxID=2022438 RepID=UPI0012F25175